MCAFANGTLGRYREQNLHRFTYSFTWLGTRLQEKMWAETIGAEKESCVLIPKKYIRFFKKKKRI